MFRGHDMEATTKQFNLFADGKGDGWRDCIVCGRTLKANDWNVEIGIDGYEFGTTDETESQGGFGIGSSFRKNFKNVWQSN